MSFLLFILQDLPDPKMNVFEQYGPIGLAVVAILALFAVVKIVLTKVVESNEAVAKTMEALKTIIQERLPGRRK